MRSAIDRPRPRPCPGRVLAAAELLEDHRLLARRRCPGRCRALRCAGHRRRGARPAARCRARCSAPHWRGSSAARGAAIAGRCATHASAGTKRRRRPRAAAIARNSDASGSSTSASGNSRGCGTSPPRFQPRHVEQAGQQVAGGIERAADLRHGFALPRSSTLLRQRVGEQLRGMQRLHQVVADRGEEAALGVVGALGFALGDFQVRGARGHALLQRLVGLDQRRPRRDGTAVTSVKVATKPPPGIGLPRISMMLPSGSTRSDRCARAGAHVGEAPLQRALEVALRRQALQRPAREIGDRASDLQQLVREAEQLHVAPVPRHQPQLRIDHADALAHVLQRRLEHALVEAQVGRGLADDRGDGVEVRRPRGAPHPAARAPRRNPAPRPVRARRAPRPAPAPRRPRACRCSSSRHAFARQEAQAGVAQRLRIEAASRTPRRLAAHTAPPAR